MYVTILATIAAFSPFLVFICQDIMEIRKYLRVLNGKTAAATALILYNLGSAGVLGEVTWLSRDTLFNPFLTGSLSSHCDVGQNQHVQHGLLRQDACDGDCRVKRPTVDGPCLLPLHTGIFNLNPLLPAFLNPLYCPYFHFNPPPHNSHIIIGAVYAAKAIPQ